jgi:mannitol-specific phosphotransferase system IIBC component
MKSITQYLEEAFELPSGKSQKDYENELVQQMSDEDRVAFLKEKARKEKRNTKLAFAGAAGLGAAAAYGSSALYNRYSKKGVEPITTTASATIPRRVKHIKSKSAKYKQLED